MPMKCERRTEQCEGGGTGRRARLRGVWFTPYGFDSRSSHQPLRASLRGTQGREVHRPVPVGYAGMAELADALDSGSSESNFMQVQVLFPAPQYPDIARYPGVFFVPEDCMRYRAPGPDAPDSAGLIKGGAQPRCDGIGPSTRARENPRRCPFGTYTGGLL